VVEPILSNNTNTLLKRPRLSDEVVTVLVRCVLDGTYPAGTRLPAERALAEELGVTRTSLREALRQMESMGVVRIRQGAGVFVLDWTLEPTMRFVQFLAASGLGMDPQFLLSFDEVRRFFAVKMLELAAERASDEDLDRIQVVLDGYPPDDTRALLEGEWDFRFHREIARATKNPIFVYLLNTVRETFAVLRSVYLRLDAEISQSVVDLNTELLAALRDRDGARAVAVLETRMNKDAEALREMAQPARRLS
jgi:GntR family transcriptional repressor for pyruvate dehydrogenase complex